MAYKDDNFAENCIKIGRKIKIWNFEIPPLISKTLMAT